MSVRLLSLIGLLLLVTGCTTTTPPMPPADPAPPVVAPESDEPATPQTPPADTAPPQRDPEEADAPEPTPDPTPDLTSETDSIALPDPLYAQTEDALRLAFTDGLFGLYRAEADPADAQRLDREEIGRWLTDLELVSPRAVAFAREILGPVLDQPYVVGLLLENAAQTECASIRDVLYIPVPERFQGPERAFNGYIIQDACDITSGDLAPFCFGGFGTSASGATCGCTCTTGEAPAQPCVSC